MNNAEDKQPRDFTWRGVVGAAMLTVVAIIALVDRYFRAPWFFALLAVGGVLIVFDAWRQAFRIRSWRKNRDGADSAKGG